MRACSYQLPVIHNDGSERVPVIVVITLAGALSGAGCGSDKLLNRAGGAALQF
jgi:hypothetical protein